MVQRHGGESFALTAHFLPEEPESRALDTNGDTTADCDGNWDGSSRNQDTFSSLYAGPLPICVQLMG